MTRRYPNPLSRTFVTKLTYKNGESDEWHDDSASASTRHAERIKTWIRATGYRHARIRDIAQYELIYTGDPTNGVSNGGLNVGKNGRTV